MIAPTVRWMISGSTLLLVAALANAPLESQAPAPLPQTAPCAATRRPRTAPAPAPPRPHTASATGGPRQVMVEDVYKNVQLLKGISVAEFQDTMGFISAAVGANCVHCHVEQSLNNLARFADDTPLKRRARQMIAM